MKQEVIEFDIIIVGAGPCGLSAAIRLAQLNQTTASPLSIAVIDKGADVGSQILSGAVIETRALDELLPDWKNLNAPLEILATQDIFYLLTEKKAIHLPTPPPLKNHGNYIISLENFCSWLKTQAENLGVAIFPGFSAVEILYDAQDKVCGVLTGTKGVDKNFQPTDRYQAGIKLLAQQTLLAEGARGFLTKQLIEKFNLKSKVSAQTYAIGIKELWEISAQKAQPGTVIHSVGWPLDTKTYGGGFFYHGPNRQLAVGLITGLDYKNPYLDPFQEMQKLKKHPKFIHLFENARRICYGARALCEGGWQSLPKLTVPGAMIIGDSAGTLNVAKIKGTHTAMKSGILAAETIFAHRHDLKIELKPYEQNLKKSWLGKELYKARNIRPSFQKSLWAGLAYSALDTYILRGKAPWTFQNREDHLALAPAKNFQKINYPKPDNQITFDKLSSLHLANLHYHENQPSHLQIINAEIPIEINLKIYDAPETRYCPANVYEILNRESNPYLQINAANCVQCKTCDIKDPRQNINVLPPEGGDGPNYVDM